MKVRLGGKRLMSGMACFLFSTVHMETSFLIGMDVCIQLGQFPSDGIFGGATAGYGNNSNL